MPDIPLRKQVWCAVPVYFCSGFVLVPVSASRLLHPARCTRGVGDALPHALRYHIPAGKLYKFLDLQRMYNN